MQPTHGPAQIRRQPWRHQRPRRTSCTWARSARCDRDAPGAAHPGQRSAALPPAMSAAADAPHVQHMDVLGSPRLCCAGCGPHLGRLARNLPRIRRQPTLAVVVASRWRPVGVLVGGGSCAAVCNDCAECVPHHPKGGNGSNLGGLRRGGLHLATHCPDDASRRSRAREASPTSQRRMRPAARRR
jgi:hypothetical protein